MQETIHACALSIYGLGVLITGSSGVGKSELTLQLIDRGHKFIADDIVVLDKTQNGSVILSATNLMLPFLFVRGVGFLNISKMFGMHNIVTCKQLDLIINLVDSQEKTQQEIEPLTQLISNKDVLDIKIPQMELSNNKSRPLALLVEVMVQYHKDKSSGYDSHQDFLNRHSFLN